MARILPAMVVALGLQSVAAPQLTPAPAVLSPPPIALVTSQAYLKASNTGLVDLFGQAVAMSGDTLVVGAMEEDSLATGVNGDQANDGAPSSGAAYVFVRTGTSWSQQGYIKASNTNAEDAFGTAVAVSGDTIVVGAWLEDSSSTGVGGPQGNDPFEASGAGTAYVFERQGGTWSQSSYLKASNTGSADTFGSTVAICGDTVVVGAPDEASQATGVGGDQADDSAYGAGAAYVFLRHGGSWVQQAYLKASNTDAGDHFGGSLALCGNLLVVGAADESSDATGVDGDGDDDSAPEAGAAYVFARNGATWSQLAYLKGSSTDAMDYFGQGVALAGDTVVAGAPWEDSQAIGIGGDSTDDSLSGAGAAWAFDLGLDPWSDLGFALAGVNGLPDLAGTGTLEAGSPGALTLAHANASAPALLFVSLSGTPTPFKGGTLVPVPVAFSLGLLTDAAGIASLPFVWPAGVPDALPLYFQCAILDPAVPQGVALSNALLAVTP